MNLLKAVEEVLRSANEPLTKSEITEKVIGSGLWSTSGKTPEHTVGARVYSDIKKEGEASVFVKVSPGVFGLREFADKPGATSEDSESMKVAVDPPRASASFSFTECAEKVLTEFGATKPMHYKEITRIALEKEWLFTEGKTPEASMYAKVISEIKRRQKRGESPRFVQHGRGYLGLTKWMRVGLAHRIDQHNSDVRTALRKRLLKMTPGQFEELISQLLAEMGFTEVEVTPASRDGGIDVRGTLLVADAIRIKMAVQVKKWNLKRNIQTPDVQKLRGSLGAHEQGLFVTTSGFSRGAVAEADKPDKTPIALMDGEQLVALLVEYGIGVTRSTSDLFEIDEEALAMDGANVEDTL